MSLASHYNTRVHPAEVLVDQGQHRLIRHRETLDSLLAPEVL
jgi:diaminopimelate decarboxylase